MIGFYSIAAGSELAKVTVGEYYCPRATCLCVLLVEEEIAAIVITTAGRPDSAPRRRGWGDD
jgi:hypothetical protein